MGLIHQAHLVGGYRMINKKRLLVFGIGILILVASVFLVSCKKSEEKAGEVQVIAQQEAPENEILYYTCGMHPSVRVSPEDYEKGSTNCPICNMGLVPIYKEEVGGMEMGTGEHEGIETLIKLSPDAQAIARVKTEEVQFLPLFKEIYTVGQMDYDERKVAYVAAWIPGRIDKLFVDFTGIEVKKDDPLVWIYSPDLVTTQQEYLLALETLEKVKGGQNEVTIRGAESLVEASKRRLLLWGISEKQIEELNQKKKTNTHMTIYASLGGTVIHKNAFEGKYVKEGENLYKIADLSTLWMLADIYEY